MVTIPRALVLAVFCVFAVAGCTNPNTDTANTQSNRATTSLFNSSNTGGGGGGGSGY
jgi:uncharacterized membrane protein